MHSIYQVIICQALNGVGSFLLVSFSYAASKTSPTNVCSFLRSQPVWRGYPPKLDRMRRASWPYRTVLWPSLVWCNVSGLLPMSLWLLTVCSWWCRPDVRRRLTLGILLQRYFLWFVGHPYRHHLSTSAYKASTRKYCRNGAQVCGCYRYCAATVRCGGYCPRFDMGW